MATLFLSYSREDAARVRLLASALEREGHIVWWDKHIPGGDEFAGAIEQALEAADVVVVAWSAASIRSAWVRDEAASGRDSGRLVPLTLDGSLPPLGFRQYQTIDLSSWNGRVGSRQLKPLKQAIEGKAAGGDPDKKQAAPPPTRPKAARAGIWVAAALILLVTVGGGAFYWGPAAWGGAAGFAPKVTLGSFAAISSAGIGDLPQVMKQEILAAFGADNAVAVIDDADGSSSAAFVMDGSISKLDDRIRFTINLKNKSSERVVWSQAYDRALADPLAPRQVAVAASQVVRCGLWGASSYPERMSDQALALYLQFCSDYWGGSASEATVLDAARRVTVAVPDFSFGWSALALAAVPLSHMTGSQDKDQLREEAIAAANKSIELDDHNPEGYMALAGLLPTDRYAERERLLKKAITVRPTECGCERQAYGDFLTSVGRMEEAVEQYERARAMMPLVPLSNLRFAHALYVVGRHEEADKVLGQTLELWPDAISLRLLKLKSALWTKRYDEALELLRGSGLHFSSAERDALIAAFEALKSPNQAQRAAATGSLEAFARDPRRNGRLIVGALAALDAKEAALQAAKNLVRSHGPMLADVLFEPNLAAASHTPGYNGLVRQLGLAAYWQTAGQLPDICRDPARPGFCSTA